MTEGKAGPGSCQAAEPLCPHHKEQPGLEVKTKSLEIPCSLAAHLALQQPVLAHLAVPSSGCAEAQTPTCPTVPCIQSCPAPCLENSPEGQSQLCPPSPPVTLPHSAPSKALGSRRFFTGGIFHCCFLCGADQSPQKMARAEDWKCRQT